MWLYGPWLHSSPITELYKWLIIYTKIQTNTGSIDCQLEKLIILHDQYEYVFTTHCLMHYKQLSITLWLNIVLIMLTLSARWTINFCVGGSIIVDWWPSSNSWHFESSPPSFNAGKSSSWSSRFSAFGSPQNFFNNIHFLDTTMVTDLPPLSLYFGVASRHQISVRWLLQQAAYNPTLRLVKRNYI